MIGWIKNLYLKTKDFFFLLFVLAIFLPFFVFGQVMQAYLLLNYQYGLLMSFIKFAVLATMGEAIGLRIKTGHYNQPGFGLLPRAVVWGLLGITIHFAFVIFPVGVTHLLERLGLEASSTALSSTDLTINKLFVAFSVSLVMNLVYAPVMMTMHKITDTHILSHGGSVRALIKPIRMGQILSEINWEVQWSFVFKKTIPLFWVPAHTITFLLPEAYRVLFAALLGIMLGVILAVAAVMGKQNRF